jgi:peptidoglycan/xylan/chitin deacetylase (PgdA/CDA1 family)
MRARVVLLIALLLWVPWAAAEPLVSLVWHDITPSPGKDRLAVTPRQLERELNLIKSKGYTPVSLRQLKAAHAGKARLPHKPILLCFDDGLKSYRTLALPLLRRYGYPSVLSVVTGWVDGKDAPPEYSGKLMTWNELRKVSASPLVEIASHSDDLHHNIRLNRQGNRDAAAITREYLPFHWRYESETEFVNRVRNDLARSRERLNKELGIDATTLTWPYGRYDDVAQEAARGAGFGLFLTLEERPTGPAQWPRIGRVLVAGDLSATELAARMAGKVNTPMRFVEIHLDAFSGVWPPTQERLLSTLLQRIRALKVNTVIVSGFSRDGKQAFFPNSEVPVAADILSRVLDQIWTRTRVRNLFVSVRPPAAARPTAAMWRDLARLNHFNGMVFEQGYGSTSRKRIEDLVKRYRSRVRFVVAGNGKRAVHNGLVLWRIDSSGTNLDRSLQGWRSAGSTTLVSVDPGGSAARAVAVLRKLRSAGVRNYGVAAPAEIGPAAAATLARVLKIQAERAPAGDS